MHYDLLARRSTVWYLIPTIYLYNKKSDNIYASVVLFMFLFVKEGRHKIKNK